ncbi:MAG: zinc-ribbon domain-containing protein [Eubacterium sp.]|nr:zinc-ribbon domain-containing protein [Eubacterium sp.]
MKFCGECGAPMQDDEMFCTKCGTPFDAPVEAAVEEVKEAAPAEAAVEKTAEETVQAVEAPVESAAAEAAPAAEAPVEGAAAEAAQAVEAPAAEAVKENVEPAAAQFTQSQQQFNPNQQYGGAQQFNPNQQYGGAQQYNPNQQYGGAQQFNPNQQYGGAQFNGNQQYGGPQQFNPNQQYGQQRQYVPPKPAFEQVLERPVLKRDYAAIITYIGWLGFLIAALATDRKERYFRFHFNQSLVLNIFATIGAIIMQIGSAVTTRSAIASMYYGHMNPAGPIILILGIAVAVIALIGWIIGLIAACRGQIKEAPLFGKIQILK